MRGVLHASVINEVSGSSDRSCVKPSLLLAFSIFLHSHFPDHAEKFVDIFQKTALGEFLSALTEEERQMVFQCYVTDFIVLTIGVSSAEELQVSV